MHDTQNFSPVLVHGEEQIAEFRGCVICLWLPRAIAAAD
jgi:hypothetical protein